MRYTHRLARHLSVCTGQILEFERKKRIEPFSVQSEDAIASGSIRYIIAVPCNMDFRVRQREGLWAIFWKFAVRIEHQRG